MYIHSFRLIAPRKLLEAQLFNQQYQNYEDIPNVQDRLRWCRHHMGLMQKEVADRISAEPNSKAYGSLSIAVQYYMTAKVAFIVPRTVFVPAPNVDSAILKMTRREQPLVEVKDEDFLFRVAKASFVHRRKTLWNNLTNHFGKSEEVKAKLEQALEIADIKPSIRGEALSISDFAHLSDALREAGL